MKFEVIEFPSSMFTWVNGKAIAEASDMGNRHLQRLHDDAVDLGFKMRSEKTGEVVTYVMQSVVHDLEGEVVGWQYVPTSESFRRVPGCADTEAMIYND